MFITTLAAGNSWSQHSPQAFLLPTCSPWDKLPAAALTGHTDPLLLPGLPECRYSCPIDVVWLGVGTAALVKQLDQLRVLRAQGTTQPGPRWGYHNHQTPYKEGLSDNVIVLAKNISFWSFGISEQVFYLFSESGLRLQLWTSHLFSLVTHSQPCLWSDLPGSSTRCNCKLICYQSAFPAWEFWDQLLTRFCNFLLKSNFHCHCWNKWEIFLHVFVKIRAKPTALKAACNF